MKGHVREQGAGNWYAIVDVRDPQAGKRKRKWHSLPGSPASARRRPNARSSFPI